MKALHILSLPDYQLPLETLLKSLRLIFLAASLLMTSTIVDAAQTNCPEHYAGSQAPDLINQKLSIKAREVCYSEFALMHSGVTRTPLYSAERLTNDRLTLAKSM